MDRQAIRPLVPAPLEHAEVAQIIKQVVEEAGAGRMAHEALAPFGEVPAVRDGRIILCE